METLSILIPAYNWDCSQLISDLHAQAEALGIEYEIIVADDHSTNNDTLQAVNRTVQSLVHCRLIALERNIGRSAIRNFLADNAIYDWLLFMDCDAAVCSPDYLRNYMPATQKAEVICGGLRHPDILPQAGVELRWKYEKKNDKKRSAKHRGRTPYAHFTPFNFMISRKVFQSIRFSSTFKGYGYEDVLFGIELEKRQVPILHIDNPLLHLGLEDNTTFIAKTGQAISNLVSHKSEINQGSTLLRLYNNITNLHLSRLLKITARKFTPSIKRNLLSNNPSLKLFSLYKLFLLSMTADKEA